MGSSGGKMDVAGYSETLETIPDFTALYHRRL